jgi:hypothetical protein
MEKSQQANHEFNHIKILELYFSYFNNKTS